MLGRNQCPCPSSGQTDITSMSVVKMLPVRDSCTLWNFMNGYTVREIRLLDTGYGHESSNGTEEEMRRNKAKRQNFASPPVHRRPASAVLGTLSEHTGELNSTHPLIKKDFA